MLAAYDLAQDGEIPSWNPRLLFHIERTMPNKYG